jgi:hypothetical protein
LKQANPWIESRSLCDSAAAASFLVTIHLRSQPIESAATVLELPLAILSFCIVLPSKASIVDVTPPFPAPCAF